MKYLEIPKRLLRGIAKKAGRARGTITVRHRGGGAKRKVRVVDFLQGKIGIPAKIRGFAYDPGRTALLALAVFRDGEQRLILAAQGMKAGDEIVASHEKVPLRVGNRMPISLLPVGTEIHNVELSPGRGGQLIHAGGSAGTVIGREDGFVQIRMPSGEIRRVPKGVMASIGKVALRPGASRPLKKAGERRWRGIRPTVRGKAMHPAAHPHGGGEGRSPIGLPYPKSPTGKPARGVRTRRRRATDYLRVQRRR